MISNNKQHLLYVEPNGDPIAPIIDELTRKMTAAFRLAPDDGPAYRGFHQCTGGDCEATSSNREHVLPNGMQTNSLCIHYLACHRSEIPQSELNKVKLLNFGEAEPTYQEMQYASE